jgi:hypothetical protein
VNVLLLDTTTTCHWRFQVLESLVEASRPACVMIEQTKMGEGVYYSLLMHRSGFVFESDGLPEEVRLLWLLRDQS